MGTDNREQRQEKLQSVTLKLKDSTCMLLQFDNTEQHDTICICTHTAKCCIELDEQQGYAPSKTSFVHYTAMIGNTQGPHGMILPCLYRLTDQRKLANPIYIQRMQPTTEHIKDLISEHC
jgi:hypothetical protein